MLGKYEDPKFQPATRGKHVHPFLVLALGICRATMELLPNLQGASAYLQASL